MWVEKEKYFSVTVFIIKDFCTVQTFPFIISILENQIFKIASRISMLHEDMLLDH